MFRPSDRAAAWLSRVWPGFGQLAQGRWVAGAAFAVWTALSSIALASATSVGVPPKLVGAELAIVSVWALVDAYHFKRPTTQRRAT